MGAIRKLQINNNNYSIAEIVDMLDRKVLHVNTDYQRGSGIWPAGPSAYFIDTILENYPCPKIYMYEYLDPNRREMRKEIVDGQQRISAIIRFLKNEFPLGSEGRFAGLRFQDLEDDMQLELFSYSVSVDVIRNARRSEILQMFRRMNAYTLPLNDAEKRHSTFQGPFKWAINEMADEFGDFFVEFGVFTDRQIVRMSDASLIAECIIATEEGIINSSPTSLNAVYKKYDTGLGGVSIHLEETRLAIRFIYENFGELRKTFLMKPYALHSLITALVHSRYGIDAISNEWNAPSTGHFAVDPRQALRQLMELAQAHEAKEEGGPHATYVWGCLSSTHRKPRRVARVAAILRALGVNVQDGMDANLS
jgi:hypothetical protein